MKFFDIYTFIISLAVGFFFIYITNPEPMTIYVYPTTRNMHKLQYIDKAENVFAFKPVRMKCPKDESNINKLPVQQ